MARLTNITVADNAGSPTEPVDLTALKAWLSVDFTDHDALITALGKGARVSIEQYTGLALVTKAVSFDLCLDKCEAVTLPYGTPSSVVVKYITAQGADGDTVESGTYAVRGNTLSGLNPGRYKVAYLADSPLNEALKEAIKLEVAERYQHRGESPDSSNLSAAARAKAAPFCQQWL